MQTFRSTVKLTPEILTEYIKSTSKIIGAALYILAALFVTCILIILLPHTPNPLIFSPRYRYTLLFTLLVFITAGIRKYILPHIHRTHLRSELHRLEKHFNTSTPTLESRIEDNTFVTRCTETGREERSPIHGKTVVRTEHYLFIRCSRDHLAIFTLADFSEEVLDDLLSTLAEYGADIPSAS